MASCLSQPSLSRKTTLVGCHQGQLLGQWAGVESWPTADPCSPIEPISNFSRQAEGAVEPVEPVELYAFRLVKWRQD